MFGTIWNVEIQTQIILIQCYKNIGFFNLRKKWMFWFWRKSESTKKKNENSFLTEIGLVWFLRTNRLWFRPEFYEPRDYLLRSLHTIDVVQKPGGLTFEKSHFGASEKQKSRLCAIFTECITISRVRTVRVRTSAAAKKVVRRATGKTRRDNDASCGEYNIIYDGGRARVKRRVFRTIKNCVSWKRRAPVVVGGADDCGRLWPAYARLYYIYARISPRYR